MVFQYDVVTLIELVESHPCLWDKTNQASKNKILREKCWQESFAFLETGYEEMSKNEKKNTGNSIVKKWSNVSDSFMKSLRTKTGQGFQKKYIYAENLHFLLKIAEKDNTDSNLSETESSQSVSALMPLSPPSIADTPEPLADTPEPPASPLEPYELPPPVLSSRQKKKTREPDIIEREILSELRKKASYDTNIIHVPVPSKPNEKEIMLLSFFPYMKDLNETEMLDLHMEILTSIKKIKEKRSSTSTSNNMQYSSQLSFSPHSTAEQARNEANNDTTQYPQENTEPTLHYLLPSSDSQLAYSGGKN